MPNKLRSHNEDKKGGDKKGGDKGERERERKSMLRDG